MAKKKKLIKLTESRPTTSCYTDPPAVLRVGQDLLSYYIPEFLLQSLKGFSSSVTGSTTIDLVDVDAGTGHVIAHFLHTGAYQTLADRTKFTSSAKATIEFKKAILSFVAAKKYGLTALQELAKAEAVHWSEEISIVEVLQTVDEDGLMESNKDTVWLQYLMLQKADQAFNEDGGILFAAKFFDNIRNVKLAKLLAQRITNHHLERVSMLRKVVAAFENEITAGVACFEGIPGKPPTVGSNELVHSPLFGQHESPDQRAVETLKMRKSASEPYSSSRAGRLSEPEPACAPEPEVEPESIEVLQPDAFGHVVEIMETSLDCAESAAGSATKEYPWGSISAARTKRTKKGSTTLVEYCGPDSPAEPMTEPVETAEDDWGFLVKKKKRIEGVVEEEPLFPTVERNPVNESQTESPLEPTFELVAEIVDPFAGLSKSQKKKLEKKMKEEAAAAEKEKDRQATL